MFEYSGNTLYCEQTALADVAARYANPPVELPADPLVVRRAIDSALG